MRKRIFFGVALILVGAIALSLRPESPDSWREFARTAQGKELEALAFDDSTAHIERFNFFLAALRGGDEEAFTVAERLYPLIASAAHASEELLEAIADTLRTHPQRTLEAMRRGAMPVRLICMEADRSAREPLLALLDGGLDDVVRECLVLPR